MKLETLYQGLGATLVAAGLLVAAPAMAAGYCSAGAATEGIAAGDVTFNGASADDCYGVTTGNLNGNSGAAFVDGLNWGSGWTYLDASNGASAGFMGLEFTVSATPGIKGSWTLTGIDTNGGTGMNLPATLDFAIGLKAGNEFSLWGFDNVTVDGADGGAFSIVFTNRGGNPPSLSHLIVFGRESGAGTISAVPEADTYAMLLAGLGLVGFVARRKLR